MKNLLITSAVLLSICAFSACSGDHQSRPGTDSLGNNVATNPYRDTFAVTTTQGDATNLENSGSGGTKAVKVQSQAGTQVLTATAPADTAKKADTAAKK